MIQMLFAGGIDVLEKETGLVEGSRPLAFATKDVGAFLTAVYGSDQTEQIEGEESAVGLGAGQVVICRNAEGKARAKEVVQNAICLTVLEAKGLEYDVSQDWSIEGEILCLIVPVLDPSGCASLRFRSRFFVSTVAYLSRQ